MIMRKLLLIPLFTFIVTTMVACSSGGDDTSLPEIPTTSENPSTPSNPGDNNDNQYKNQMKMKITVNGTTLTATMEDNAAVKDLMSRLPLEVTLNDFNSTTEKIFYPEPALNMEGVTRGCAPLPGDITIYAPWGNVAIFCKKWSYSDDLVKIGHIDSDGIKALTIDGDVRVKLEKEQ